jgi:hypothetical protein
MRSTLRCLALLPLLLAVLVPLAHADPMDDFLITGSGLTIDFSVPASTTTLLQLRRTIQFWVGPRDRQRR